QQTFKVAPERANHAFWIMQKKPELQPLNRMPENSAFFTYARRRILIIGQCDAFNPDDNIQIKIAIQPDPVNFSRIPTYGTPTCRFITKAAAVPEMGFSIETQTGKMLHVETSRISCPILLRPYNLTDRTWVNGIHKNRRGFFIENTALNQACLSQPSAKLSIDNTVTDFQLNITMKYIEVWIEQAILDDASDIRLQVQSSAP
ncbi:MAG: hypothetical protein MRY72_07540, partial [Aquisalinus sp.]|nr:hypothetical protein [Aquisalinus sp.]